MSNVTVIDKSYPNAVDEGWRVVITGDLIVKGGLDIQCNLFVTGSIKAGWGIKAGEGIEAGWGIEAGEGIEAGDGIEAGWGIKAKTVSSKLRIFAGLCSWMLPTAEEKQIRCEKLLSGTIEYGELVIINPKLPEFIEQNRYKYKLVEA